MAHGSIDSETTRRDFFFITYLLIILLQVPTVLSKTTRRLQSELVEILCVSSLYVQHCKALLIYYLTENHKIKIQLKVIWLTA